MTARRRGWDNPWPSHAESKPIPVADGIATSSKRGAMADSWWSQQFVEVLDRYGLGARMQRGRRYARSGQIVSFGVEPGRLTAKVQGSRSRPYEVNIDASSVTTDQWAKVDAALSSSVRFAARLLAGEVPPELVEVFADAGVSLLPVRWSELSAWCSCPDSANPCKHIAATLYVFADRLDTDPWLLLEWRGRTREQVLASLTSGAVAKTGDHASGSVADEVAPWWPPALAAATTSTEAGEYDALNGDDGRLLSEVDPPSPADLVLRRLDDLDVKVRNTPVTDLLTVAYEAATGSRFNQTRSR